LGKEKENFKEECTDGERKKKRDLLFRKREYPGKKKKRVETDPFSAPGSEFLDV